MSEPIGCPTPGACSCPDVSPLPGEIEWRVARLQAHAEYLDRQKMGQVGTFIRESAAALERLAREIERLHERLEDNHEYWVGEGGQSVRVEVPPGSIPDGIECRNETIKLQKERIRELEEDRCAACRAKDRSLNQSEGIQTEGEKE